MFLSFKILIFHYFVIATSKWFQWIQLIWKKLAWIVKKAFQINYWHIMYHILFFFLYYLNLLKIYCLRVVHVSTCCSRYLPSLWSSTLQAIDWLLPVFSISLPTAPQLVLTLLPICYQDIKDSFCYTFPFCFCFYFTYNQN